MNEISRGNSYLIVIVKGASTSWIATCLYIMVICPLLSFEIHEIHDVESRNASNSGYELARTIIHQGL